MTQLDSKADNKTAIPVFFSEAICTRTALYIRIQKSFLDSTVPEKKVAYNYVRADFSFGW